MLDGGFRMIEISNLSNYSLMLNNFLKEFGLRSVVERGDRAYPATHMAGDVVDTLLRACTLSGVKVVTDCEDKPLT